MIELNEKRQPKIKLKRIRSMFIHNLYPTKSFNGILLESHLILSVIHDNSLSHHNVINSDHNAIATAPVAIVHRHPSIRAYI